MSKQVQNFIDDARRFQRCSDHDLAISSLQLAQQEDHHKEHEIEIQKLFSLSYRKIGNYNMALLHINSANYWDWRSESYSNNILETISLFKGIIE